jgi:hypothetical protein
MDWKGLVHFALVGNGTLEQYAILLVNDFLGKFDASGNIQWAVPNYYAQLAAPDGGLVAQTHLDRIEESHARRFEDSLWLFVLE